MLRRASWSSDEIKAYTPGLIMTSVGCLPGPDGQIRYHSGKCGW